MDIRRAATPFAAILVATACALAGAAAASAQVVHGTVRDSASGAPEASTVIT